MLAKTMATLPRTLAADVAFTPRYYDVGVNITDPMFSGEYRGKRHHNDDILHVLQKAYRHHVQDILLTGSSLVESEKTINLAHSLMTNQSYIDKIPNLFSTVGVHPCSVLEFEENTTSAATHISSLRNLINHGLQLGIVKAFGEIGLDYDRLHYTPKDKQLKYFKLQLQLASEFNLPLFLHMRAACDDFIQVLEPFINERKLPNGNLLIHSFTGDQSQLSKLLNLEKNGYKIYISLNGASLRDQTSLDMIPSIPLNRLMIETDSPWCEIKKTHPSYKYLSKSPNPFYPNDEENYELQTNNNEELKSLLLNEQSNKKSKKGGNPSKITLFDFLPIPIVKSEKLDSFPYQHLFIDSPLIKSRNEPCLIGLVAEVVAKVMDVEPETLVNACYENSKMVFNP